MVSNIKLIENTGAYIKIRPNIINADELLNVRIKDESNDDPFDLRLSSKGP